MPSKDDFDIMDENYIEVLNEYDDWTPKESMLGKISGTVKKAVSDFLKYNIMGLKKDSPNEKILQELFNYLSEFSKKFRQEGIYLDRFMNVYSNYLDVLTNFGNEEIYSKNNQETLKKICNLIYGYDFHILDSALKFYQNSKINKLELLFQKHKHLREKGAIFKKCKPFLKDRF